MLEVGTQGEAEDEEAPEVEVGVAACRTEEVVGEDRLKLVVTVVEEAVAAEAEETPFEPMDLEAISAEEATKASTILVAVAHLFLATRIILIKEETALTSKTQIVAEDMMASISTVIHLEDEMGQCPRASARLAARRKKTEER
jgi:hypothetical protein